MPKKTIAVAGIGYVGLSNAVLLSQHHTVRAFDISEARVEMVNARKSPLIDPEIEQFLAEVPLDLTATTDPVEAFSGAEFIIVATPTNYDPKTNFFDTSTVEKVIETIRGINSTGTIVIKSTIPVGFTRELSGRLGTDQVIFSPEFLREGRALYDNLHPSRIVVGEQSERAHTFAELLKEGAQDTEIGRAHV